MESTHPGKCTSYQPKKGKVLKTTINYVPVSKSVAQQMVYGATYIPEKIAWSDHAYVPWSDHAYVPCTLLEHH